MSKIKFILVAIAGWLGLLFTAFIYYITIAGLIKLF